MPRTASHSRFSLRLPLRALAVWLLLAGAEILHGIARRLLLEPLVGDFRARQIAVFTGSALLLGLAYLCEPWLGARSRAQRLAVGALWLALMLGFELLAGRLLAGYSWQRIASDYDLPHGGLLPLGMAFLFVAPLLASRLRRAKTSGHLHSGARPRLRLLLVALGLGTVFFLTVCLLVGGSLVEPAPAGPFALPADLPFEAVTFPSASGSTIHAWLGRGRAGAGAVILLHGLRANRSVEVPRARLLWRAGYSVLLIDLQAHGESPGRHITFGYLESRDVRAAIGYVRQRLPGERLGGIGTSLGGAAILIGPQPAGFDAVVLESVYPTLREAVEDRIHVRLGPLAGPLTPFLLWQLRPRLGVSPDELRPIDGIGRLGAPLLLLAGDADRHTPLAESRRLFAAARAPKELWIVPGAAHVDLYTYAGEEYARRILAFLAKNLR